MKPMNENLHGLTSYSSKFAPSDGVFFWLKNTLNFIELSRSDPA
jgi:hypothetical protein